MISWYAPIVCVTLQIEQQIEVDDNTDVATYVADGLSHLAFNPRPPSRFQNGSRGRQGAASSPHAVYVGASQQSASLEQILAL